jgi:hypothetical protein
MSIVHHGGTLIWKQSPRAALDMGCDPRPREAASARFTCDHEPCAHEKDVPLAFG